MVRLVSRTFGPSARRMVAAWLLLALAGGACGSALAQDRSVYEADVRPPGDPPASASGATPPAPPRSPGADLWRDIREGQAGDVLLLDRKTAVLIQVEGLTWRWIVTDTLTAFGAWLLLLTVVAVAALYAVRGRVALQDKPKGRKIRRFSILQTFVHWLVAVSFLVLALTGLSQLYGKDLLAPLVGADLHARIAFAAKHLHTLAGLAFAAGILLLAATWFPAGGVARELRRDRRAGGARDRLVGKFGWLQRVSWAVFVVGGLLMVASGGALLFPFTFGGVDYAGVVDMQLIHLGHAVLGLVLMAAVMVHIYLDVVAKEGSLGAVLSGYVSEAWARQHHRGWLATVLLRTSAAGQERTGNPTDPSAADGLQSTREAAPPAVGVRNPGRRLGSEAGWTGTGSEAGRETPGRWRRPSGSDDGDGR